jgi:Fic family protein
MKRATLRPRPDPRRKSGAIPETYQWKLDTTILSEPEQYEKALRDAQAAASILRDDQYVDAYQSLIDKFIQQLIGTKPDQIEEREDLYFRIRGLQEMAMQLNGRVQQGILLQEELNKQGIEVKINV